MVKVPGYFTYSFTIYHEYPNIFGFPVAATRQLIERQISALSDPETAKSDSESVKRQRYYYYIFGQSSNLKILNLVPKYKAFSKM